MNPRLYYNSAEKVNPDFEVLDKEFDEDYEIITIQEIEKAFGKLDN